MHTAIQYEYKLVEYVAKSQHVLAWDGLRGIVRRGLCRLSYLERHDFTYPSG
jgi:hypothetical protein